MQCDNCGNNEHFDVYGIQHVFRGADSEEIDTIEMGVGDLDEDSYTMEPVQIRCSQCNDVVYQSDTISIAGRLYQIVESSRYQEKIPELSLEKWLLKYKPLKTDFSYLTMDDIKEEYLMELGIAPQEFDKLPVGMREIFKNRLWTLIEEDGGFILESGYRFVNRVAYFITKEVVTDKVIVRIRENEIIDS